MLLKEARYHHNKPQVLIGKSCIFLSDKFKKVLVLCLVLLSFLTARSQNSSVIDSLDQSLKTVTVDSVKLGVMAKLGEALHIANPRRALNYLLPGIQLAMQLGDVNLQVRLLHKTGTSYKNMGEFDKALDAYLQSATISENTRNYFGVCQTYVNVVYIYISAKNYKKAAYYIDRQIEIIEKHLPNDPTLTANIYEEKAALLRAQQLYDAALTYTQKLIDIDAPAAKQSKLNTLILVGDFSLHGLILIDQGKFPLALKYFDSCIVLLNTIKDKGDLDSKFSGAYNNLGSALAKNGQYDEAQQAFETSLQYAARINGKELELENYQNMANMYADKKDYRQQAIYLQKFYELKDSLLSVDKKIKMTEVEADYQIEKKNVVLAQQEAETARQKNQRNIFIFIAAIVVLVLATLGVFYRRIRSKNHQLALQNATISQQKESLQQLNTVKDKLFSVISHDLRHPIASLKTFFALAKNKNLSLEKQEKYQKQMEQSVNQTGNLMDNLLVWAQMQLQQSTPRITTINLTDAIENVLAEVAPQASIKDIEFIRNIQAEKASANTAIFEIAFRNLVSNAIKYSTDGDTVHISSKTKDATVLVSITDNGVGMTAQQIANIQQQEVESSIGTHGEKGSGLGLFLVIQLLQQLNGTLEIESEIGKGSVFTIVLPV